MNEAIKNLNFNLTSEEAKTVLGNPLLSTVKNDVVILVYSSLSDRKSDVLYFVDDQLKVKSLSNPSGQQLLVDSGEKQNELYFLQADNRGTANDQWLKFYGDKGIAIVTESKLDDVPPERVIYFEPMDIAQLTKIWGGSKFIKRAEQPSTKAESNVISESQVLAGTESNAKEPYILIGGLSVLSLLVLAVLIFIVFHLKRRKQKVLNSAQGSPTPPPPVNQPPLIQQ